LRIENEQGIDLDRVIHSITQITHTFSGGDRGGFPQVVHRPDAGSTPAGDREKGKRARSGAREVLDNLPSLRVRFSTVVWT
jgi:hypothetical protein